MEFILIPAGEFYMGAWPNDVYKMSREEPLHLVTLASDFYMGKYEVTQKQWRDVMGTDSSYFKGDNLPVEQVSWNDAQEFIIKLNEKEGTDKYRLPSEAEWEYAARADTTTVWSFGNDESDLGDYAWYGGNSGGKSHPVGQKKPNPWGLYDMHVNVYEWVQDQWHGDYIGAPTDGTACVEGSVSYPVDHGGCWGSNVQQTRSAFRDGDDLDVRSYDHGFRLLREL